jgi:hypothetical protein
VQVDQFGGYIYKGGAYGNIEFPAQPQDHAAVDQFLGLTSPNDDTYSGGTLPSPAKVTVAVLNGSGVTNQATDTAQSLAALGFHIGSIGDSAPVGREAETVVYYSTKSPAALAAAQTVANALSGAVIMARDPGEVKPGSQVTVVTGTDFSVNPPAAATPATGGTGAGTAAGTTSGGGSASTSSSASSSSSSSSGGAFQPPTSTTQPLQPWDPRSCTAGGGEGA